MSANDDEFAEALHRLRSLSDKLGVRLDSIERAIISLDRRLGLVEDVAAVLTEATIKLEARESAARKVTPRTLGEAVVSRWKEAGKPGDGSGTLTWEAYNR